MNSRQSPVNTQERFRVASYKLQVENQQCRCGKCGLSAIWRSIKSSLWVVALTLAVMLLIVGCSNTSGGIATFTPPAIQPKILVTVYISPTPNAEQQQAIAAANPPTATLAVIPTASATPYIGVFLGEVDNGADGGAIIPPALLGGATSNVPVTLALGPACPSQADVAFGTRWSENVDIATALGCPIEGAANLQGTLQIFERGVMYYSPTGEIWAISPIQSHYWYALNAPPVQQGDLVVPEGMMAPSQGFGAVWRGLPGVQDALGFAKTPEQGTKMVTQKFQNGVLLADGQSGQVFVLLSDGRAMGPY
ncbi:MAG: hypothetical protein GC179_28685 [Anaerolineaceae bacterium]|nr:hypothetical protein [Anaerolineaceae bacterium]